MAGPAWLPDTFAAVMLVMAAYCAVRLAVAGVRRRETEADTDGMHLVMGAAMAGMLAPGLSFVTPAAWTAVFSAAAAWFAWQAVRVRRGLGTGRWRCPYPVPHLAESLAMVYMVMAVRTPAGPEAGAGMAGMGGAAVPARAPELAVVFTVFMVGYVAWLGDRFSSVGAAVVVGPGSTSATAAAAKAATGSVDGVPARAAHAGGCWPELAPRGACCSKIVMAIVMAYMLMVML
ncbi:MAG TPA: DUF5134 domain-containing protein [Trebonia sp.]